MARTDVTITNSPGKYPAAGGLITWEAADTVNQNQVALTGREMLLAWNQGASPQTVTITSSPDRFGRTKDITAEAIAVDTIRCFGVPAVEGWRQSDGQLYFEANSTDVYFAVIRLT